MTHLPAHNRSSTHASATPEKTKPTAHASVKSQVVAGFIVFRRTREGTKYLFLYRRGGYWNFPKGHFEKGENAMHTALREVQEETGLTPGELRIVPGFKTYVRFHFFVGNHKIMDTVILYLAESKQDIITISPREHSGFAWFLYRDACHALGSYRGIKRALAEAHNFLHLRSGAHKNNVGNQEKASGSGH